MYELELTHQYLKDLSKLNKVILKLISGEELPQKNRDHSLTGNYKGFRECHISPDWLLIYSRETTVKIVTLIRTGTHSDLF